MGEERAIACTDRYLDLLKRVLTRTGFTDVVQARADNWKRWFLGPAQSVLASSGYTLVQRTPGGTASMWANGISSCETIMTIERLDAIQRCAETALADGVPGDLVEVGVWRGGASIFLRAVLAAHGVTDRCVWLADSYEGFPAPSLRDPADRGVEYGGGLAESVYAVDLETVKANFARYGLLDEQVKFLPGWFHDTLPRAPVHSIALLLLDGDLYGSTRDALNALYPKVSPGGFVIVDDYGMFEPCRRAVDEYRADHRMGEPVERVGPQMVLWRRGA